jgi:hypothetical protein
MALQIRRGLEADRANVLPAQGELLYTTDDKRLYIGDGNTLGGNIVSLSTTDVRTTVSNQFVHSGHNGVTFTYDSLTGRINAQTDGIYIAGDDSVSRLVNLGEGIKITGAGTTSVTTDAEGNVTVSSLTHDLSAETTSGGANLRLSTSAGFDDVKLANGTGISITRTDASTITITNTGAGGGGSGTPGGSDTQIQFNDGGVFGGSANLTFDKTTNILSTFTLDINSIITDSSSFSFFNTATGQFNLGGTYEGIEYSGKLSVLDVDGYDVGNPVMTLFASVYDGSNTNTVTFSRARGTLAAKTKVEAFDAIGGILFSGYDGANEGQTALIACITDATPVTGSSVVTGLLVLQTADDNGALLGAIFIDKTQSSTFTGDIIAQKDITNGTITISNNVISTVVSNANLELRSSGTGAIYLDNISINNNTIDTLDSSGIVVVPAATFNSDVTVENDLNVGNKVYAKEFISTSVGTPEITSSTTIDLNAASRTRITGGLFRLNKLSSADIALITAENGDLIYNTDTNKFQGYENGIWVNLI